MRSLRRLQRDLGRGSGSNAFSRPPDFLVGHDDSGRDSRDDVPVNSDRDRPGGHRVRPVAIEQVLESGLVSRGHAGSDPRRQLPSGLCDFAPKPRPAALRHPGRRRGPMGRQGGVQPRDFRGVGFFPSRGHGQEAGQRERIHQSLESVDVPSTTGNKRPAPHAATHSKKRSTRR